jgi:hypothetical protein
VRIRVGGISISIYRTVVLFIIQAFKWASNPSRPLNETGAEFHACCYLNNATTAYNQPRNSIASTTRPIDTI